MTPASASNPGADHDPEFEYLNFSHCAQFSCICGGVRNLDFHLGEFGDCCVCCGVLWGRPEGVRAVREEFCGYGD